MKNSRFPICYIENALAIWCSRKLNRMKSDVSTSEQERKFFYFVQLTPSYSHINEIYIFESVYTSSDNKLNGMTRNVEEHARQACSGELSNGLKKYLNVCACQAELRAWWTVILKLKFLENIKYSFHSIPIRRSNLLLYKDFEAMEFYFWI